MSFVTLPLILLLKNAISQSDQQKYCPSTDWILCGTEKNDCIIEPGVKSTTISYGLNQDQQSSFVFWDVSNSNSIEFKTSCDFKNLGDPWSGQNKGCCFQNNQQINHVSPNNANWTQIASEGQTFDTKSKLAYIRYGVSGHYVYRWMHGTFKCSNDWFPDISTGNTKNCYINNAVNTSSYKASTFIPCGSSQGGGECNTHIVPNGNSISLIQYGASPNWVYSYGYNSNYEVPCSNGMFKNGGLPSDSFCNIHNATVFPPMVVGSWIEVDSCTGCAHLDESITEGTTSTSTEATTQTWSDSLSETVSEGLIFEKVSMSYTVGYSVSDMVSESYSYSSSHTCDAQCGNGTKANWYMYQWQMNAQEYQKADVSAFNIFTCVWVCNTQHQIPKCPPGYCKDFACQTCIPYQ